MSSAKRKRSATNGADEERYAKDVPSEASYEPVRPTKWPALSPDQKYRELYAKPPDFKQLAQLDPDFAHVVKGRELDFNDPASVMQLTKTLLKLDFGLTIDLPEDRLCPPVANRHNYILWLKALLDTSSYEPHSRKVVGLDIGTGASCIYPLLGCAQRPWSFIATDIDEKSIHYARQNVKANDLEGRIRIVQRDPSQHMIPLDDMGVDSIDFCMTNPPFYQSEEEMLKSAREKSRPPSTACTGIKTEMVTEGGEIAFVGRILTESLVLRERVQWYTSMFGFLSSVTKLLEQLKSHGIDNYAVTEFVQGSKTRRWAVAWSFGPMRPAQAVCRGIASPQAKALLPTLTEHEFVPPWKHIDISSTTTQFVDTIAGLDLVSWDWDKQKMEGSGRTVGNVWNRAWRRKKQREAGGLSEGCNPSSPQKVRFGFGIWIKVRAHDTVVGCRWLEGHDYSMFESFQGFIKATAKKLGEQDQNTKGE